MNRHRVLRKRAMGHASAQGFNVWAVSINLLLLGALLVMALSIVPSYMEYLTIKDLITRAAAEHDSRSETVTDLRVRLAKLLNTNQFTTPVLMILRSIESGVPSSSTRTTKSGSRFSGFWMAS